MAVIFNLNQSIPFPLRENYFHVALCPHIKETKGAIPAFAILSDFLPQENKLGSLSVTAMIYILLH